MEGLPNFNARTDASARKDEPGDGDDVPCVKCGGALDTGLECSECGHDNYEAVTGKPFAKAKPAKCDGNHGGLRCADPECWNDTADVRMPDDEVMRDALEHLAGLDTHDVNLRDNPKAYEVLERLVRTCYAPGDAVEPIRWVNDGSIPDADELVLVEGPDHGDVWGGCYDGEQWLTQDGMPVDVTVLAWAQWPAGSKGGAV
ncbi:hypothetical protein [Methyloversatilis sp.]|uniref:hypothetical protein n=1 Tax=Methyloversatilis sp. TaxID=2569862 RepID=UPI003D2B5F1C